MSPLQLYCRRSYKIFSGKYKWNCSNGKSKSSSAGALIKFLDHILQHQFQNLGEQAFPFRTTQYNVFPYQCLLISHLDNFEDMVIDFSRLNLLEHSFFQIEVRARNLLRTEWVLHIFSLS